MSQPIKKDKAAVASISQNQEEDSKDEFTIRLSAQGQIHLVELLENPAPIPEVMKKAKEESIRKS